MNLAGAFAQEAVPGLHDIVVPEPVSWVPATVGWPVAALVVLGLVALGLRSLRRKRAANRYRVDAMKELAAIEASMAHASGQAGALAPLPVLVKRVALSFARREEVASLTGEPWLAFLDRSYGGTGFTQGPGRALAQLGYASLGGDLPESEASALLSLVREWIRTHDARSVRKEPRHA